MQLKKSITINPSDNNISEEVTTVYSTDANLGPQHKQKIVQSVLLIWLDENIDESNVDCRKTIEQLCHVVNSIDKFTNSNECIEFLDRMDSEKACMVISNSLAQDIVPRVHNMSQVDSIFIFPNEKQSHEEWIHKWSKIKGIYTDILPICEALTEAIQQYEQNAISITFIPTGDDSTKKLDQLEPSFMYIQIMKEILLSINFEEHDIQQYINYCRNIFVDNERELRYITKFEREYQDQTPVWWYTLQCFLYPMLNRALRLIDIDIMIKMGFVIKDLYKYIEELHQDQFDNAQSDDKLLVYRGQGMSKTEFEQMTKTQGGLISFNNFLSTSENRSVSLRFVNSALANPDLMGVLFVMTIDPSRTTTPFASIKNVSYFKGENEVLFAMQTVFRIGDITPMDENPRLFQVELTLTSNTDKDLRQLTDFIREETFPNDEGWYRLGSILLKMDQFDKAEHVYKILLEQTTNEDKMGSIYNSLGATKHKQAAYKEAITFYEKAIEIYRKNLISNPLNLAATYSNIGETYRLTGEYSIALSSYEKSLAIRQQLLPSNHRELADSYHNIAIVYSGMGEYSKALLYYKKSTEIDQKTLPSNHPSLALSYNNIGSLYAQMNEYEKALLYFERSLAIQERSLPPNHSDLADPYNNIGLLYANLGQYSKALSYLEKALEIRQKSFPSNHPDIAASYNNIGNLYEYLGEYSKALSYFEKSLEIEQQTLSPYHSALASSYNNIGNVYYFTGAYLNALSYYEKSLEIRKKLLPSNHSDLAASYENIGNVYSNAGEYSKALLHYEKAFEIREQSLPPNHLDLAKSYNNIGSVYHNIGDYPKTLFYFEKSLEIRQKILPSDHPDIAASYNNIGGVYDSMGENSKALSYFEKSLEVKQQSLPSNHPSLAMSCYNIGCLYENMHNYSKAQSFFERAVTIGQQSLPTNHPHLQLYRTNLEAIKKKL